jgi:hypothetical protein
MGAEFPIGRIVDFFIVMVINKFLASLLRTTVTIIAIASVIIMVAIIVIMIIHFNHEISNTSFNSNDHYLFKSYVSYEQT